MEACIRCGWCCTQEVCDLALAMGLSQNEPCSALEKKGKIYSCGLVTNPKTHIATEHKLNDNQKEMMGKYFKESIMNFGSGCGNKEVKRLFND